MHCHDCFSLLSKHEDNFDSQKRPCFDEIWFWKFLVIARPGVMWLHTSLLLVRPSGTGDTPTYVWNWPPEKNHTSDTWRSSIWNPSETGNRSHWSTSLRRRDVAFQTYCFALVVSCRRRRLRQGRSLISNTAVRVIVRTAWLLILCMRDVLIADSLIWNAVFSKKAEHFETWKPSSDLWMFMWCFWACTQQCSEVCPCFNFS